MRRLFEPEPGWAATTVDSLSERRGILTRIIRIKAWRDRSSARLRGDGGGSLLERRKSRNLMLASWGRGGGRELIQADGLDRLGVGGTDREFSVGESSAATYPRDEDGLQDGEVDLGDLVSSYASTRGAGGPPTDRTEPGGASRALVDGGEAWGPISLCRIFTMRATHVHCR